MSIIARDTTAGPPWIYRFTDPVPVAERDLPELLGGKGAWLRRLAQAGYDVPPGFTITTAAVRQRQETGRWPAGLEAEVAAALESLAAASDRQWGSGESPLTVAVRSGAPVSLPGQLCTVLGCGWTLSMASAARSDHPLQEYVRFLAALLPEGAGRLEDRAAAIDSERPTSRADWQRLAIQLLREVEAARGSCRDEPTAWLWQAMEQVAAVDRFALGPGQGVPMVTAINVQAMCDAEVCGVLDSRDPLAPQEESLVIEAVAGNGQPLLAGRITPTTYRWPRSGTVAAPAPPGPLAAEQLVRLQSLAIELEQFAGGPVEVEWGLTGDRIVLFQVRTLAGRPPAAVPFRSSETVELLAQECTRLRDWAQAGRRWWVRHQLAESLPCPTPLSWSVWREFLTARGGFGRLYRRLGYAPATFPDGSGCCELIAGRIYADPDRVVQMICRTYPWRHDPVELAARPEALFDPPTHLDPARLDPWFLLKWPHLVWVLVRSRCRFARLVQTAATEFRERLVPDFLTQWREWHARLSQPVPLQQQLDRAEALRHWLLDLQAPQLLLAGWLGVQAWQRLVAELQDDRPPAERTALLARLLQTLEQMGDDLLVNSTATETGAASPIPAGQVFPHRLCPDPGMPVDLELGTFGEPADPVHEPPAIGHLPCAGSVPAAEVEELLESLVCGRRDTRSRRHRLVQQRNLLRAAAELLPLREAGRRGLAAGLHLLRRQLAEIATTTGLADRLACLTWNELLRLEVEVPERDELERRRAAWRAWQARQVPAVLDGSAADPWHAHSVNRGAESWPVRALAPGEAAGPAWQPGVEEQGCPDGAVVISESLDARSLLRWSSAAGFIVEQGGLLSHAAVAARVRQQPMVVLEHARQLIPPGTHVTLSTATETASIDHGAAAPPGEERV